MSLLEKQSASSFETASHSHDAHLQANVRLLRFLDGARAGATLLALLVGVAVLGLAGHAVQAYNASRVAPPAGLAAVLSVWPSAADGAFDFRPTVALLVGAALVVAANVAAHAAAALARHHHHGGGVRAQRLQQAVSLVSLAAPLVGLAAAVVAVGVYYGVNRSDTADTLLSWSCRWTVLDAVHSSPAAPLLLPRFGTLCGTSRAGLYLAILLVPVEALALTLAAWHFKLARYVAAYTAARRTPSPVL